MRLAAGLAAACIWSAACGEGGPEVRGGPGGGPGAGAPAAEPASAPPGWVERTLTPDPVPVSEAALERAEALVRGRIVGGVLPGAALAVGNRDSLQRVQAFGRTVWGEEAPPVDPDSTLYDLASLTKVVATTAAVMALVEDGRMELGAPVRQYLPEFRGAGKDGVTVRHLLTHTSGIPAGLPEGAAELQAGTSRAVWRRLLSVPLVLEPGAEVLYSDLGFVVLWAAAERVAGEPLPRYLRRRVWGPLGMASTRLGVEPGCVRCAPTLHLAERDEPYAGGSYDEVARRLDGVAGNAGAFSSARDLARFAAAIANEGRLGPVRVFRKRTVREFTQAQRGAGTRALGWEVYCREGEVPDHRGCRKVHAFGHTGATGTSFWIEPDGRTWVVLLTNRTYLPRATLDMQKFRRRLFDAVTTEGGS